MFGKKILTAIMMLSGFFAIGSWFIKVHSEVEGKIIIKNNVFKPKHFFITVSETYSQ